MNPNTTLLSFERLRFFSGAPREFWPSFLRALVGHAGGTGGLLYLRPADSDSWQAAAAVTAIPGTEPQSEHAIPLAESALKDGFSFHRDPATETCTLGLRLETGETAACVAILILRGKVSNLQGICAQLQLVVDTPRLYQDHRRLQRADEELSQFSSALDLMLQLNAQTRWHAAAMTLCNELAARFKCSRVSLGWLHGRYVRLTAISHMEKFERRMEVVGRMEAAMEETLDQDEEILLPRPADSFAVTRDHESFATVENSPHLCSLPIRVANKPAGVLLLERTEKPIADEEVRALRMFCDQAARRLSDLQESDGWIGKRMVRSARRRCAKLLGPEHTWTKVATLGTAALLAVLVFVKVPYRVEAPFIIRTQAMAEVPAAFDGYIREVLVRVGDEVKTGQPLLRLDDRDLQADATAAQAELQRFRAEADSAQAAGLVSEMQIALRRVEQARATLELAKYRLSRVELKAPFDGVIVEGELHEKLGAPVKRGEPLFRVARLDDLYAELKADELDIHNIAKGASADLALISRPSLTFPATIQRIEPAAVAEQTGNHFIIRASLSGTTADWWRPGMSGLAKVNAGERSIAWCLTHRAVDQVRLWLWW
jgi:RND family efflux transporter MFP subunit